MTNTDPEYRSSVAPTCSAVKVRIMIADDSYLIREGLLQLLALTDDIEVIGTYSDAPSLLKGIEHSVPDVVVTDMRMPPTQSDEGMQIAEFLRLNYPLTGVIVLSQHGNLSYAGKLLESGSSRRGYLLKDRIHDLEHLVSTIKGVAAGECRIDSSLIDGLMAQNRQRKNSVRELLTPRQREILADIAIGKSNLAIAQERAVTQRAVEKHVSEIFGRLGISSDESVSRRVQATLLYLAQTDL